LRTIRYALLLVFLLAASVILIRTLGRKHASEEPRERLARLVGKTPATIDLGRLHNASAGDLCQLGDEYLQVWRVRDATLLFERAVGADSTSHDAWLS